LPEHVLPHGLPHGLPHILHHWRVTAEQRRPYTVIYDGHCGICTKLVTRLTALDRHNVFEIVPSQLSGVPARFPWISPQSYADSLQLVRASDRRTWEGAAAVEQIIRQLNSGWTVSWMFSLPFARRIAERSYRWVADHRGELGCGEHCRLHPVPSDADADTGAKNS
jgi:predicted DCC family thiol-disulfide oxidoreductase YuxK